MTTEDSDRTRTDNERDTESERAFSGRFTVRMSRYLHRRLTDAAQEQGVSLNQFICTAAALAAGLDTKTASSGPAPGSDRVSDEEFSEIWARILA